MYKFFDKINSGGTVKDEILSNNELAEELHKRITRKFKKREAHASFMENIWSADLADMQLISKFNKGFRFLLCVTDIYSKHACLIPLKDKEGIKITNAFQNILDKLNRKLNKIWADKDSEFCNRSIRSSLQNNDIEMYSTHNKGKSVDAERFIRTLKKNKYMAPVSKNVYIDKLKY